MKIKFRPYFGVEKAPALGEAGINYADGSFPGRIDAGIDLSSGTAIITVQPGYIRLGLWY